MNQGRVGRPIRVTTNSFEIKKLPAKPFYHYDVITKKDSRGDKPCPRHRCGQVVDKMQTDHPNIFNPRASYDGYKNLFCSKQLSDGTYTVHTGPRTVFEVTIVNVSRIDTSDLMHLTTKEGAAGPMGTHNTIPITLLQVIISQGPHLAHNFSLHAKSFYEARKSFDLSGGIQGWRGFFQSVRPVLGRFIVNVDITAATFYTPGSLMYAAAQVLGAQNQKALIQAMQNQGAFEKVRKFFKGVVVEVRPSGLRKKITNLVPNAGDEQFEVEAGMHMTIAEYWAEHHNIPLSFPKAFGVQTGYGDAIFPAEVCKVVEGQRYKKKLTAEDTTRFIQLTKTNPDHRIRDIRDAVSGRTLDYTRSLYMIDAGMEVSTQPIQVDGRVLPPPIIHYGAGPMNVSNGAWNVMRQRMVSPGKIDRWGVMIFDNKRDSQQRVGEFLSLLVKNMIQLGMTIQNPPVYSSEGGYHVWESLSALWYKIMEGSQPVKDAGGRIVLDANGRPLHHRPSLILVILPRDALEIRKQVKQWGDVKFGIPTQCVREGRYDDKRGRDQYCNNVALKINAKIGGVNNFAQPVSVASMMTEAMFVGCDVSHPAPGVYNRPSVASLVASTDQTATKYHVFVSVQMPRQEIISEIGEMLRKAIEGYRGIRKTLPKAIVIYRDGVSEGEYARVEQGEIMQIEAMIKECYKASIHFVFIVVGKRHHVRFFPNDRSQADKSGNCPAGLVVDTGIVHSKYIDFYLQSHSGLIGTSRPGHYVVLKNTPNVGADQLQELSYALCYVYAVATRSVSIPAPVYYADRVCARVADFQFRPDLYDDDHSTDAGRGPPPPFPLNKWKEGLGLSQLTERMYFL